MYSTICEIESIFFIIPTNFNVTVWLYRSGSEYILLLSCLLYSLMQALSSDGWLLIISDSILSTFDFYLRSVMKVKWIDYPMHLKNYKNDKNNRKKIIKIKSRLGFVCTTIICSCYTTLTWFVILIHFSVPKYFWLKLIL